MASITYRGWARLKPLGEHDGLVPLLFPLDREGRYLIGSSNLDEVNLLVPKVVNTDGSPLLIEAVVTITKDGELMLERPPRNNATVMVNGEIVKPGTAWRAPVPYEATVSLGPWQYRYMRQDNLLDDQTLEKTSALHRCDRCQVGQDGISVMLCGHNLCTKCRQERTSPTIPSFADERVYYYTADGRLREEVQIVDRFENPLRPWRCHVCGYRITANAGSSAMYSLSMDQTARLTADFKEQNESRPICDGCRNQCGLMSSRDYDFCETCQKMLCAVCVLQWHRQHQLKPRLQRLKDLDEVDHKLSAANLFFAALERLQSAVKADKGIAQIAKTGHRPGAAMKDALRMLDQELELCREQLANIRDRKRALSQGWDETSQSMAFRFARHGQQYQDWCDYVEKLRNCEISLTCSVSSDETVIESASSSVTTSGAASSAPSTNAPGPQ